MRCDVCVCVCVMARIGFPPKSDMRDRKGNLKGRKGTDWIRKMTLPRGGPTLSSQAKPKRRAGPFSPVWLCWALALSLSSQSVPLSSSPGLGRWTATGTWVSDSVGYLASLGTSALAAGAPGRIPVKVPLHGLATVVLLCKVKV